jgi:hypothetical protein
MIAMRLIDADALSIKILDASWYDNADEDVAWELLQDAPNVDSVSVVRCEECKNRDSNDCPFIENDGNGVYTPLEIKYCGLGERKDGAE